ncbi:MAG: 4-hydroxybutyrate CoA transferase, partial [Acidimicrobiia bacterium]|nr:4-hydroxybutyrate CoA transferase [Acidimicrobiia bacterium]
MRAVQRSRRQGRRWVDHYERHLVSPREAVAGVSSGDRVYVPMFHESPALLGALAERAGVAGVEIRALAAVPAVQDVLADISPAFLRGNWSFGTPATRAAIRDGGADFTVVGFGDVHRHIDQRRANAAPYDVCWITATPPDDAGYCCVGAELWDLRTAMQRSRTTVAALNHHLPRTFGVTRVHVSEIDMFVSEPRQLRHRSPLTPSPAAVAIAAHVSPLVPHRATLQIGAGKTSGALAVAGAFDDKEDLGYFAETSAPGLADLVERGVITSKYATVRPNKFVTTGLTGGADDYAYANDNPFFEFLDYDTMLNPAVISRNDNL